MKYVIYSVVVLGLALGMICVVASIAIYIKCIKVVCPVCNTKEWKFKSDLLKDVRAGKVKYWIKEEEGLTPRCDRCHASLGRVILQNDLIKKERLIQLKGEEYNKQIRLDPNHNLGDL